MKSAQPYIHPMNLYPQRIKEEGIVVFDGVRELPTVDEPFVSSDYVICIGHRGRIGHHRLLGATLCGGDIP